MRSVLLADITYRSRVIARDGLAHALNTLSPAVRYQDPYLDVQLRSDVPRTRPVSEEGLTLTPSFFVSRASVPTQDDQPPSIVYPVRGQGAMWGAPVSDPGALRKVFGTARTRILETLREPATSTELAVRLHVTASAVNQHLRVLHQAGLLNRTQHGRSVLYYRSEVADRLLHPEA